MKSLASHHDYAKYFLEGCKSIEEISKNLKGIAKEFEKLAGKGAKLSEPVSDGHIFYSIPGHYVTINDEEDCDIMCSKCYKVS